MTSKGITKVSTLSLKKEIHTLNRNRSATTCKYFSSRWSNRNCV